MPHCRPPCTVMVRVVVQVEDDSVAALFTTPVLTRCSRVPCRGRHSVPCRGRHSVPCRGDIPWPTQPMGMHRYTAFIAMPSPPSPRPIPPPWAMPG